MATALQQQLAAVAAKSTHQLDLKAQKSRHSESLLYDAREASRQSFDELYQTCLEGFEELCELDSRFARFAKSILGPDSKSVEREQLTAQENRELDGLLESFLGLVQERLLLRPAQKSVEWLVRRFRVHEYNTEALLLTFLPYHAHPDLFPAVLALLPQRQLPESFKWLFPYISSLTCPPRHAILAALTSNKVFFASINTYTFRLAKHAQASSILLGFWASIMAQAVSAMFDSSQSGRENVRRQREEDLLLRILPVLQEALSISSSTKITRGGLPELYIGASMIITILVTKASLEDQVLDAVLEAVAAACDVQQTLEEGLTCLAVIAEEKRDVSLPHSITRKLLVRSDDTLKILQQLSTSQSVNKLTTGFGISIVASVCKKKDLANSEVVRSILAADILSSQYTVRLLSEMLSGISQLKQHHDLSDVSKALLNVVIWFNRSSEDDSTTELLQKAAESSNVDLSVLGVDSLVRAESIEADDMDIDPVPDVDDNRLQAILDALPQLPTKKFSFLAAGADYKIYQEYADAFQAFLPNKPRMQDFLNVPALNRSRLRDQPQLLSLLARIWSTSDSSSDSSVRAAVQALSIAKDELEMASSKSKSPNLDFSALLPYLILALASDASRVRKAAAALCKVMHASYQPRSETRGSQVAAVSVQSWTAIDGAYQLLPAVILPVLEECILDSSYVIKAVSESLNGNAVTGKTYGHTEKGLKKQLRSDLCSYLAAHLAITPVSRLKVILAQILGRVKHIAQSARQKILVPFVREWAAKTVEEASTACRAESIQLQDMDRAALACLTAKTEDEMLLLREVCAGLQTRRDLQSPAFSRLRHLWSSLKDQEKVQLSNFLMDLILGDANDATQGLALETLRALELPTPVLTNFVDILPSVAHLRDPGQPPSAKKRRTSRSEAERPTLAVDQDTLQAAIKRMTLTLEIIEGSKPEQHLGLLKPLFYLLAELRQYKTLTGSELPYLHGMALDALFSIVQAVAQSANTEVDTDAVRADLIVELVRTTSSVQVHNTALRLISALASWKPELVLHSVMPLFTFMSSAIFRNNDEFSTHVTDDVVSRIVPPLVHSLKSSSGGKTSPLERVSELLLSFTAAWEHIPLHRRLGLFTLLVESIGQEECLGAVLAMLIERYGLIQERDLQPFVRTLMRRFEAVVALKAAKQMVDIVFEALSQRPEGSKKKADSFDISRTLLGFADKTNNEKIEAVETLLEGLSLLMTDADLKKHLALSLSTKPPDQGETIRVLYAELLGRCMELTTKHADIPAANDVLSSVLNLMPTRDFIMSSAKLMQAGPDETRQKVFQSLEARLSSASRNSVEECEVFIGVLPNCVAFLRHDQRLNTRIAAVGCIDAICEKFGKTDRTAVLRAVEVVAGPAAVGNTDEDERLRTISMLCLASMIEVLGEQSVEILPDLLTRTLGYLASASGSNTQKAAFSVLTSVVDNVPWMLSGSNLDRALLAAAGAEPDDIGAFASLAAKKVAASEVFGTIHRMWADVLRDFGADGVLNHLTVFHEAIQHHTKATINKNTSTIFNSLLEAFDLRRQLHSQSTTSDNLDNIHDLINRLALNTTLKLNDNTFRPFFSRAVDWAILLPQSDIRGRQLRATSVFSFSLALFEQLKSLVTSYAGVLLESAVEALQSPSRDAELLSLVLKTLGTSFQNDEDGFWTSPRHFDAIALPVISQLQHAPKDDQETLERATETIKDLAAAVTASPDHLKSISAALLALLRGQHAAVRLAAVKCERRVTERLGLDWLALLPEMLPVISELQEDDNEDVERETLRWVKQIEDVTGESLEGMLA